jgi:hypothetical protein
LKRKSDREREREREREVSKMEEKDVGGRNLKFER